MDPDPSSASAPPPSPPHPPQLAREVCLHMRSCHPSITALYAAYKDARYIYLLMELAPSGNLYQMLMAMPVPAVSTQP
jgi:serine/threonine protein kinase